MSILKHLRFLNKRCSNSLFGIILPKSGPFSLGTASAPVDSFQAIKNDKNEYFWRPFQLAFQLLTIESLGNDDSNWKDLVDLLGSLQVVKPKLTLPWLGMK